MLHAFKALRLFLEQPSLEMVFFLSIFILEISSSRFKSKQVFVLWGEDYLKMSEK